MILSLNPSLIQKGLRLVHFEHVGIFYLFESFPDSEGIKTRLLGRRRRRRRFESFPDSEGIKTAGARELTGNEV